MEISSIYEVKKDCIVRFFRLQFFIKQENVCP